MKNIFYFLLLSTAVLTFTVQSSAQVKPNLGSTAGFVFFSSNGAVTHSGISHITGNIGTNNGSNTAFGNVDGTMHEQDSLSAKCSADLLIVYNQLDSAVPTFFPAPALGNGQTLTAGIYAITGASTLDLELLLDGEGNPDAVFIFQLGGTFSTSANAKVKLINGALACNVFWKIEGAVQMAAATTMRGTIIANNAAIEMNAGDTLEGRAFSTTGAVSVDGVLAYIPIGSGSPMLTGPVAPPLGTASCYAIFSADGAVSNSGISTLIGDVGTNNGLTTGFDTLLINGKMHPMPDVSTAKCAGDLLIAYQYINTLPYDIELLYPADFGHNLVLTPHTYLMSGAVTFTDSVYLNAQGNTDAVFVIQINGALSTSTYSKVILMNGAQAKNVYWKVEGAVSLNNYSVFCGTIICSNGALSTINTGVVLNGRALTTTGALTTSATTVSIPSSCVFTTGMSSLNPAEQHYASFAPNPFTNSFNVTIDPSLLWMQVEVRVFNLLGAQVASHYMTKPTEQVSMAQVASGIYFYQVIMQHKVVQSGKLLAN
jgi:hypothetical protein